MKRILFALTLLAATDALACDQISAKYATATTVDFCLYTADATVGAVKKEDAVCANTAGADDSDVQIMKDEGAPADATNAFTDEGECYSLALTASELTAARVLIDIEDLTATKVWADKCILITTYGNASAFHQIPDVNVVSGGGSVSNINKY
jgi:hypothetical protein